MKFNPSDIEIALNTLEKNDLRTSSLKKSAVLILFVPNMHKDDNIDKTENNCIEYSFFMTSRSKKLKKHSGEMSFPGGKFDIHCDSTLKDTALRETQEEIGISPDSIKILGRLNDFPTATGYVIRPFIGIVKNGKLNEINPKINITEVAALVKIPFSLLFQENLFKERRVVINDREIFVLNFSFHDPIDGNEYFIWGASAHILSEFLLTLYNLNVRSEKYHRPSLSELEKMGKL